MAESEANAYKENMEEAIAENAIKNVAKESERTRFINQPPN